ncbi:MAG: PepSY-associated TM helix domain-containing protein [Blastocatellia bacterium]
MHVANATERPRSGASFKQRFAAVSRWLHIYLSMVSFAVLFFFAVTGLTLNHTEWFGDTETTARQKGTMNTAWLAAGNQDGGVAKLEIVEQLRRAHQVRGALADFRIEETECAVSFKGPGYSADALINRETGASELTETRRGFFAVINDLHKGRDTGRVWSLVIDVSAALMTFVSLTGMALIFFIKRRRLSGLLAALVGAVLSLALYLLWIP